MSDTSLGTLKLRDLRQLEKALQTRIELLKAFETPDHDMNAWFVTLAPEGMRLSHKPDYLRSEISHCNELLDKVQTAIRAK